MIALVMLVLAGIQVQLAFLVALLGMGMIVILKGRLVNLKIEQCIIIIEQWVI
jgi:hypothetical protein